MVRGVHNYSEIGKLNKVLLHRIGSEVDGLVPDNFARLLFDDIPYLKVAQQEHDRFADILRENGVEVVYYADEVAKAIEKPDIKDRFIVIVYSSVKKASIWPFCPLPIFVIISSPYTMGKERAIDRSEQYRKLA